MTFSSKMGRGKVESESCVVGNSNWRCGKRERYTCFVVVKENSESLTRKKIREKGGILIKK